MGRKMLVELAGGNSPILEEVAAHDEAQLQEMLKQHPELLPLEELGLAPPAVVNLPPASSLPFRSRASA